MPSTAVGPLLASTWPSEMVIIRHGQSERNVAKDEAKTQGGKVSYVDAIRDQDTALTPLGMGQALEVGIELRNEYRYDAIFVSPYRRARQTADQIIRGMGYSPKITVDERLREIEFGILDGLTHEGIKAKYPEEIARKQKEGKYWYRPPGGESRPDVGIRLRSFISTLQETCPPQRVLIVCHSVVVLMFRHILDGWHEADYLAVDKVDDVKNGSMTCYQTVGDITPGPCLRHYNVIPSGSAPIV